MPTQQQRALTALDEAHMEGVELTRLLCDEHDPMEVSLLDHLVELLDEGDVSGAHKVALVLRAINHREDRWHRADRSAKQALGRALTWINGVAARFDAGMKKALTSR